MNNTVSVGPSAMGLLGIILVILKLLGKISISWFWVLAPFWIGLVLAAAILFFVFAIALLAAILDK